YTRGDLAEALAMGILPFVFWTFYRVACQPTLGRVVASGVSYALLILCHNLTAVFATPILLVFLLVTLGRRLTKASVIGIGGTGLLAAMLSAGYWLPVLTGLGRLNPSAVTGGFFDFHKWFMPIELLLQPGWAFDYRYAFEFGARFNSGRAIFVLVALAIGWVLLARPIADRLLWFATILLVVLFWLETDRSVFLWEHIPVMRYLQFPYRLNAYTGVPAALLLGAFLAQTLRPRFGADWRLFGISGFRAVGTLLGISVVVAVPLASLAHLPAGHLDTHEAEINLPSMWRIELDRGLIGTATRGDYLPPTVPGDLYELRSTMHAPTEEQHSPVELTAINFNPLSLVADVQAKAPGTLIFDRIADPVWQATLDGKPVAFGNYGPLGELTVTVPAGDHRLQIYTKETVVGRIGDLASGVSILIVLAVIVDPRRSGWPVRLAVLLVLAVGAVAIVASQIRPPRPLAGSVDFGQAMRLVGARVEQTPANPPGAVDVTLAWETLQAPLPECTVHLRLLDVTGKVVARRDKPPLFGLRSCTILPAGEIFRDRQQIRLPAGVPAGSYRLAVGLSVGQTSLLPVGDGSTISWQDADQPSGQLSHGILLGKIDAPPGPSVATVPGARAIGATINGDFLLESAKVTVVSCPTATCVENPGGRIASLSPALTRFFPFLEVNHPDLPTSASDSRFIARLAPGSQVDLDLLWRSLRDVSDDYSVFTHLESLQHQLIAQDDDWPDRTNFPTSVWFPGDTLDDRYYIVTKPNVPPGVYNLIAGMYMRSTSRRFPTSGPFAEKDQIDLGMVKISQPGQIFGQPFTGEKQSISLNGEIKLIGSQVTSNGTIHNPLSVRLAWRALHQPSADYTVFVHVLDANGRLVAQHDSQPMGNTYPTSDWDTGDTVYDSLSVALPTDLPAGIYQVSVGMYRLKTGERLKDSSGKNEFVIGSFRH
ncbi:MAG TPA: hypothetical protein VKX96_03980, partial [Chloroflexota bacterium]|nr:hypothetical protein [Chloroflexota bacterium]